MRTKTNTEPVDVCLVVEGTYPFVTGGVSSWAHDLILNQPHLSFHVVCLLAKNAAREMRYVLPKNMKGLTTISLQDVPPGRAIKSSDSTLFTELEPLLLKIQSSASEVELQKLVALLKSHGDNLGARVLLDSEPAFELVERMYRKTFSGGSFIDYFWSWRSIFGGLFSVLIPKAPEAKVYHALCTGFAGLYSARVAIENNRTMLLTEHGIYTNERRIELGVASWFRDIHRSDLSATPMHTELRDLWSNCFASYSRISYGACKKIVTLFEENQLIQYAEGAQKHKLRIIPNGINVKRFARVAEVKNERVPTFALVGRVVPIKGVKTFIMACQHLKARVPNFRALVLGPTDEDPEYFSECQSLVDHLHLTDCIEFAGQVKLTEYLHDLDVLVLTSLSEAQPLVILEAGAAKIPVVATDVGACRQLIFGSTSESPNYGAGGNIAKVADANDIADKIADLLQNPIIAARCGEALHKRVLTSYTSVQQHESYRLLYAEYCEETSVLVTAPRSTDRAAVGT